MNIDEIRNDIKKILSEKRYEHSVNVMNMCEYLAKLHDVDIEKAKLVGIAHDIAREMSKEEMFDYANKNNIEIDSIEKEVFVLLHAKIGADICKKKYNFTEDMVNAISAHTITVDNMDNLAKVLYISDAISEDRKRDYVQTAKEYAKQSLDKGMVFLLESFIQFCKSENKIIHPNTIKTLKQLSRNEG